MILELSLAEYGKPSSIYEIVETRSSNDGRSQDKLMLFLPSLTGYLDAQVTFLGGHSGLREVAEEKCLRNHGLAHPGSARTSQVCTGYTSNPGTLPGWMLWC